MPKYQSIGLVAASPSLSDSAEFRDRQMDLDRPLDMATSHRSNILNFLYIPMRRIC